MIDIWQDEEFHIRAVVRLQDGAVARTLAQLRPIATVTGRGTIDITPSNVSLEVDAINGAIAMDIAKCVHTKRGRNKITDTGEWERTQRY